MDMIDSSETDDAMDGESSVDSTDGYPTDGEGDDEYDNDSQHSEHRPPLVVKPVVFEITMPMPYIELARRIHLRNDTTLSFRRYFQRSIERLEDDHELNDVEDVFERSIRSARISHRHIIQHWLTFHFLGVPVTYLMRVEEADPVELERESTPHPQAQSGWSIKAERRKRSSLSCSRIAVLPINTAACGTNHRTAVWPA